MEQLKDAIVALPLVLIGQGEYLSYQATTDLTAAFLFPDVSLDQLDDAYTDLSEKRLTLFAASWATRLLEN